MMAKSVPSDPVQTAERRLAALLAERDTLGAVQRDLAARLHPLRRILAPDDECITATVPSGPYAGFTVPVRTPEGDARGSHGCKHHARAPRAARAAVAGFPLQFFDHCVEVYRTRP
jgi:hypothetical protein